MILERDAGKWFKPAKGQFQVFYKPKTEQPEQLPDFVAETEHFVWMVETKATKELESTEAVAKAEAGAVWCKHASDYAAGNGGKPWKYLLVPHERVIEDKRLVDFYAFERKAGRGGA